jgi:para-nitrobenzyl esterase
VFRTARTRAAGLAAALLTATVLPTGGTAGAAGDPPVVRTEQGALHGVRAGAVDSFLGIPYAAPPTGALRWRPPRPAAPWSGVRAADRLGNACPAPADPLGSRQETEDCLYLNVQRPAGAHGARLPVYVWIHGGALLTGSSGPYDGRQLVRNTGVVVVTINYRLGVFGFLGHPALTAENAGESGNDGLLDQQAALRWVHRNIAGFGGNPRAVTIGGESAGGWSVCAHLAAPGSRRLFSAAIVQSGGCVSRTQAAADTTGTAVAAAVGCADAATALACLRAVPTGRLLDATPAEVPLFVRGGRTLPRDPRVAIGQGRFARVPVIIGANRDEGRTFTVRYIGWTGAQYEGWARATFGPRADAVLARYPWPAAADRLTPAYLTGAVSTDSGLGVGLGGCPGRLLARDLARHTRTYTYRFDHRTGPGLTAGPPGYVWGAGHGAELQYFWPAIRDAVPADRPFTAAERRLAREMVRYWGAFLHGGRPLVAGQPYWPGHADAGQVLSLRAGGRSTVIADATLATQHRCGFWDAVP